MILTFNFNLKLLQKKKKNVIFIFSKFKGKKYLTHLFNLMFKLKDLDLLPKVLCSITLPWFAWIKGKYPEGLVPWDVGWVIWSFLKGELVINKNFEGSNYFLYSLIISQGGI